MARPRQLGVCLLIAFVALLAPPLRAAFMDEEDDATVMDTEKVTKDAATMMDTEKVTKEGGEIDQLSEASSHTLPHDDATVTETEKATKDSTFQTPSTEPAIPHASPPDALVQEKTGFLGTLLISAAYQAIKGLVGGLGSTAPRVVLKATAMDLAIHSQMRNFWEEAQYICTGTNSPTMNYVYETSAAAANAYWTWYSSGSHQPEAAKTYGFGEFQKKIDDIEKYVQDRCNTVKTVVGDGQFKQLWTLAAVKCSNECGELPGGFQFPDEWLGAIAPIFDGSAVLDSFCNELWEEIKVILSECHIEVGSVDCAAIWKHAEEHAEHAATEAAKRSKAGQAVTIGSRIATGAKIAGVVAGAYVAPWETIASFVTKDSGIDAAVKTFLEKEAERFIANKVQLSMPNKTKEMVDDYCNKALEVSAVRPTP